MVDLLRAVGSSSIECRAEPIGLLYQALCHLLQAMADLFALQRIHQEILFRNDDLVAPEKAKAIARMVEELCSELRGVAVPLVDAFAIPDHILRAPIGLSTSHKEVYAAYLKSIGWD